VQGRHKFLARTLIFSDPGGKYLTANLFVILAGILRVRVCELFDSYAIAWY
jgi:hypothetical protein